MKVSVIQFESILGDVWHNMNKVEKLIREALIDKPDVVIFPELWNTSFYPDDLREKADVDGQDTKKLMSSLAKEYKVNIVAGSVAVKKDESFFNTSYIFNREGKLLDFYEKIHTFSMMGEDKIFSSGDRVVDFFLDGVHCGIIICYDLRFPELARSLALKGIEILFIPAQWPESRTNHWRTLNRARAIENQLFVCAVNGCGSFGGHSLVIDPWGDILYEAEGKEVITTVEIELSRVKEVREKMKIFEDRRDVYSINHY